MARPKGIPMSDEWKKAMSLRFSGKGNPFYGKKHSPKVGIETARRNSLHVGPIAYNWRGGIDSIPGRRSWIKNKRNRLKRTNGGSHTYEEWQYLKEKYNHSCLRCFIKEPEILLTEDHIIPISKGGLDDISNIQPLCQKCNTWKMFKIIDFRPLLKN